MARVISGPVALGFAWNYLAPKTGVKNTAKIDTSQ